MSSRTKKLECRESAEHFKDSIQMSRTCREMLRPYSECACTLRQNWSFQTFEL